MIQQLICTCCLVSAPKPIATLHPLSSSTFIPPSALQIRPYSAFKSLSATLYFLNRFFISRSISVCWLLASGLKIPMQTQWQQQDRSIPEGSPPRGHPFQDNNHERLVTPRPSMRPITEGNSMSFSLSDGLIMNYVACLRNDVSPCSIPDARATIDRQPDSPPCARHAPAHASPPARPPCTSTARARARAPAPTPAEQAPARASAPACRAGNRRKPARQAPAHSSSPARASARVTRTRDAQAPGPARPARAPARAPARPPARPPCTITARARARPPAPARPPSRASSPACRAGNRHLPALQAPAHASSPARASAPVTDKGPRCRRPRTPARPHARAPGSACVWPPSAPALCVPLSAPRSVPQSRSQSPRQRGESWMRAASGRGVASN